MLRILLSFILVTTFIKAQIAVEVPFTTTDGVNSYEMAIGLAENATNGIDSDLGEAELPPLPPAGIFDARFILSDGVTGTFKDYRYGNEQSDTSVTHKLEWQLGTGTAFSLNFTVPENVTITLKDLFGGFFVDETFQAGTHNYTIPNTNIEAINVIAEYVAGTVANPPAAPSNLVANATVIGEVNLSWNDNSDNESGFRIERKETNGSYTQIAQVNSNVELYTDMTVSDNTTYQYRIYAFNVDGNSGYSNVATITTLGSGTGANPVTIEMTVTDGNGNSDILFGVHPEATDGLDEELGEAELPPLPPAGVFDSRLIFPDGLTGSFVDYRQGDSETAAVKVYNLEWQYSAGASSFTLAFELPTGTVMNIQDLLGGLIINQDFYPGESEIVITNTALKALKLTVTYQGGVVVNPPAAPSNLMAEAANPNLVELSWNDNSENENGFIVERAVLSRDDFQEIAELGADITSYQDVEVSGGITYKYRVKAFNDAGSSDYSNVSEVTTPLPQLAPYFTAVIGEVTIAENSNYEFQYEGEDPNSDDLTFALTDGPENSNITEQGLFTFNPSFTQAGNYDVIVSLTDNITRATVFDTSIVIVTNLNRAPEITNYFTLETIPAEELFEFQYEAIDPDNDDLEFSIMNAPPQSSFDNGLFSWTPDREHEGSYTFTVKVSDGEMYDEVVSQIVVVVPVKVSMEDIVAIPSNEILMPLNVVDFMSVGSVVFRIDFNTSALTFMNIENINSDFEGVEFEIINGDLVLTWNDEIAPFNGANIEEGKLLDIRFKYLTGSSDVTFIESDCELLDISGEPLITYYDNGSFSSVPLAVLTPNGGEEIMSNQIYEITWFSNDIEDIKIEFSVNSGSDWMVIEDSYPAAEGLYEWSVPNIPTFYGEIRISDVNNPDVFDISDGVFIILQSVFSLSGNVLYDNVSNTPIYSGMVKLYQSGNMVTETELNPNGSYQFEEVMNGVYDLVVESSVPYGGVNSTDALLIQKHTANFIQLEGLKLLTGDVNLSGATNSTDALLIQKRTVNYITSYPNNDDWTVEEFSVEINGENFQQDVLALTTGDVNASYNFGPVAKNVETISIASSETKQIKVNENFTVPVYIGMDAEINAVTLQFEFNENLAEFEGVEFRGENMLYNNVNGNIIISWASLETLNLKSGDLLLNLKFKPSESLKPGNSFIVNLKGDNEITGYDAKPIELGLNTATIEIYKPTEFSLKQNYPNPFNPSTIIEYELPVESEVVVEIYNIVGEKISELVNEKQDLGVYKVEFNAKNLASGLYIYRIIANSGDKSFIKTQKMMLLK